ncbi:MAG: hypothetical protein J5741_08100 [Bacteroidales bacterium]|nr:hypothetical protein [Bacteroidales bacterium]
MSGYDTMHLFMGYDGSKDKRVCDAGFANANSIINHCAKLMPALACAEITGVGSLCFGSYT